MTRLKTIGLWLLQALLAFVMFMSGIEKFRAPAWERMFRVWGYPDHFYLVIGAVEAIAGLGLLVPKVASPSAAILVVVMCSAAVTQITHGERNGVGEMVLATLLSVIAYARWKDAWRGRKA